MKNKFGFTVPELLIVMSIAGILTIISLYTVNNRFTDFFTRYYAAYDALNKAVYNTYTDTYCRVSLDGTNSSKDCITDGSNYTNTGRPFPDTTKKLCNRLKEYLNAVEGEGSCDAPPVTNPKKIVDNGKKDSHLQFALSNGFRLYFSNMYEVEIPHGKTKKNGYKFFIVYVDLNGKMSPNRFTLPHPDIVPFIATFKGDVIPVGLPVLDKTYATARVVKSNGQETKSFTIDEARQIAFGSKIITNKPDDSQNCPAFMYTDIPITLMHFFHNDELNKKNLSKMLIPPDAPPFLPRKLGNDKDTSSENYLGCACGTFNCMMKIDENFERRH